MCFKHHLFWILFIQKMRWRIGCYQCCSPVVRKAQQPLSAWPHIAHGCSNQVLGRASIQWGLYCCSVLFLLIPFQEPCAATSICPSHHFSALHKIPLPRGKHGRMLKLSVRVPAGSWGQGPAFLLVSGRFPAPTIVTLSVLQGIIVLHAMLPESRRQHSTRWDGYSLK